MLHSRKETFAEQFEFTGYFPLLQHGQVSAKIPAAPGPRTTKKNGVYGYVDAVARILQPRDRRCGESTGLLLEAKAAR